MKNLFMAATAAILLAGPAFAQALGTADDGKDNIGDYRDVYVDGEGDSVMAFGGKFGTAGARIMGDTSYARPADCPAGSLYWSAENMLAECDEGGAAYATAAVKSGDMRSSGDPYPEGTFLLTPNARTATGDAAARTGAELDAGVQ